MTFTDLSKYEKEDTEKRQLIDEILNPPLMLKSPYAHIYEDFSMDYEEIPSAKFCPQCHRKYGEEENFCFDCLVKLKQIRHVNVKDIEINPEFAVKKTNEFNSFKDIFTQDNLDRMEKFKFRVMDFKQIIKAIKMTVLKRLDETIKDNDILLEELTITEKVLLFAKCFVNVGYKSYGAELGYFEFNRICIDDRQLSSLQITTIFHELSHFLLKEIIAQAICEVLDCSKTPEIESIAIFILSYDPVNRLIDEYAAHTVEGRFTLFGYQDYSSYLNIEKTIDLPADEIEMIKTIGNSFSVYIKEILESFIDDDMLEDIKEKFRREILDRPNYEYLALENCRLLNNRGLIGAIKMVVCDGFLVSMDNIETLKQYNEKVIE